MDVPVFLVQDTACLDGLHRLGNALRRQGEGKAYVAFAQRAKAGTRRAQHTALFHKVKTEVHALCVLCRDGCPHEHAAVTVRHIPANGTQAAAQSVAALLVQAALRFLPCPAGRSGRRWPLSAPAGTCRNRSDRAAFLKAATTSLRPTRKLMRAPVTLKLLDRLKNSTPTSIAPGVLKKLLPTAPSKMMSL